MALFQIVFRPGPNLFKQVQERFLHHVQVQLLQVCTLFADHYIVQVRGNPVLIQSESLPDQAFYPVAQYSRTDFSACRYSQAPVIPAVGPGKYDKMLCLITPAVQVAGLELGSSGQPQVFGKT